MLHIVSILFGGTLAFSATIPISMDVRWNHGAPDCSQKSPAPPLQVHRLDLHTYILRQNKCLNYEAPFLFLLVGEERALLIDTGAISDKTVMPLRKTVMDLIERTGNALPLTVIHTHSHDDHTAGDVQFLSDQRVDLIPPDLPGLKLKLGLPRWPEGSAHLNLGNRIIDILPIPGHDLTSIAIYDRNTTVLFTGDSLYPGRLYISDFETFKMSINKLVQFMSDKPLQIILGNHIEMSNKIGKDYPVGTTYQPDERPLELHRNDLLELNSELQKMKSPVRKVLSKFIIYPK